MNSKETAVILGILKVAYPNTYKNMDKDTANQTVALWQQILGEYPKEVVESVVTSYIAQDNEFPPTVGKINAEIKKITKPKQMTPQEAWNLVYKSIDYYKATENFNKLPEDIQKVLGSASQLREWACEDISSVPVNASNFMRSYQIMQKRKEEELAIPENIKQKLIGSQQKLLERNCI